MAFPPGTFKSHHEASAWYSQAYHDGIRDGKFVPFTFPLILYGLFFLLLHFVSPLRSKLARFGTFGVVAAFYFWIVTNTRAHSPIAGFGSGILGCWFVLWTAGVLIFQDAKRDWKRVRRVDSSHPAAVNGHANGHANGAANGNGKTIANGNKAVAKHVQGDYTWQAYPESFLDRLSWSLDLVTTFRGIGWNWKISGMPARAPAVDASLSGVSVAEFEDKAVSSAGRKRFDAWGELIVHNLYVFLSGYFILDLLKTVANHDEYFWGIHEHGPSYVALVRSASVLTDVKRFAVGATFLWVLLRTVYAIANLVCFVLPPGSINEPWMYPDQYGSYSMVHQRGLAGFWGGWWHQVFRFGFEGAGKYTVRLLKIRDKQLAAVVQLTVSFYCSGLMHVAGSMTMLGETAPWRNMFLFFALQPLGVIVNLVWAHFWARWTRKTVLASPVLGSAGNWLFVHAWAYVLGPMLFEDLCAGGLLLGEPVPFSIFRGLGFGAEGDGFYCWRGHAAHLHGREAGAPWWRSGVAL